MKLKLYRMKSSCHNYTMVSITVNEFAILPYRDTMAIFLIIATSIHQQLETMKLQ